MLNQQRSDLRIAVTNGARTASLLGRRISEELRGQFLRLTSHLPSGRASVAPIRHVFDNAARDGYPIAPKGTDLCEVGMAVMTAAVQTGDAEVIERSALEVLRYMRIIELRIMSVVPKSDSPCLSSAIVNATREMSEALAKLAEAGTTRDVSAIHSAVKECDEVAPAIQQFATVATRELMRAGVA